MDKTIINDLSMAVLKELMEKEYREYMGIRPVVLH